MTHKKKENRVRGNAEEISHDILPGYNYSSVWSSPEKFAQSIEGLNPKDAFCDSGWSKGDTDWYGTPNMETAIKMAREGWKEGAEQVESMRRRIEAANPTQKKLKQHGIAGVTPNVPRAVSGNVMNMRMPDETKTKKRPVITLLSNMSASCMVDAEQMTNRAAAVTAIIDKIEASGYSCEVIATATGSADYRDYGREEGENVGFTVAISVLVKRSDQPVDIVRLAYALGHASMFRRLVFADKGTFAPELGEGLGYSGEPQLPRDENFDLKSIYVLPSANKKGRFFKDEATSMREGLNFLMLSLQKQGCPAFAKYAIPDPEEEEKQREEAERAKKKKKS